MKYRVRQHVNPLSTKYQTPIVPPVWSDIYPDLTQPLHLDLGCARGKFLLDMAQLYPEQNFLGVEIRETLVQAANGDRDRLGLTNLHYLFANINSSQEVIFNSLLPTILSTITIQFPDPWFKKKHHKRRMVQQQLANNLVVQLRSGGQIFVQSDVMEVAAEIRDFLVANPALTITHNLPWLDQNPMAIRTEREQLTIDNQEPVYRALFIKQ
jgi:tRNA (guanine-N7-)-methyltransferase